MNPNFLSSSSFLLVLLSALLVFDELPQCQSFFDGYTTCSNNFSCGPKITNIDFPFWGEARPPGCGHPDLKLNCESGKPTISIKGVKYNVLELRQETHDLKIARADFSDGICNPIFGNTDWDSKLFEFAPLPVSTNITLFYNCSSDAEYIPGVVKFKCGDDEDGLISLEAVGGNGACNSSVTVRVPLDKIGDLNSSSNTIVEEALKEGFHVKYKVDFRACDDCRGSKGVCGNDLSSNQTTCYCPNVEAPIGISMTCPLGSVLESEGQWDLKSTTTAFSSIAGAVSGIIISCTIILCYYKRECVPSIIARVSQKDTSKEFDVEAFIRNYESISTKRYSYARVKKMTNSFTEKIGSGGFGAVYKGKLPDGHPVAVKILKNSKGDGEEFINEVASIGRTSHVNIVTLLGFCYERNKRALIYEYMPNGSLDKFIFKQGSNVDANCSLEWETLYRIAVGIARGLQYLHQGCNTRILHFDIKPQNILLDKELCPKISDFGLAKLWLKKESIMSMVGARGTIGYIAPEVFSRNFGGVSHKSDVYSYGMLVLEMVGGRKNFDSTVSHTGEMYYPNRIYKDLELGNQASILAVTAEEEKEIIRKMVLVSFWCIQTNPSDRPSMSKVVEMLEGSLESLEIPPKPCLFSPTRSP
ncbi:hypothetical protein UlMin_020887 [Ulmus minor]